MRLYGDDYIVEVTLWKGWIADGRPFKLDGKSGHCCTSSGCASGGSPRRPFGTTTTPWRGS
jgi:hypothetical protein